MPKKGFSYKLDGLREAQKAFDKVGSDIEKYSAKALVDVIIDLTGEAVRLAPVDTGDLRGSGFATVNGVSVASGNKDGSIEVNRPGLKGKDLSGEVGFTSIYATAQHEEIGYKHPLGGQAKYLEEPFKWKRNKYIKHLAESVKKGCGD